MIANFVRYDHCIEVMLKKKLFSVGIQTEIFIVEMIKYIWY